MSKRLQIAIGAQLALMLLVLVQPLFVKMTGTTVYLETEKMDPRSLFRGHYVILGYQVAQGILPEDMRVNRYEVDRKDQVDNTVYVVVTTDRPAQFVSVHKERPRVGSGQACIVGRVRSVWGGDDVDFPQIAQYFAAKKDALELEGLRGDTLLARVKTSGGCNAVLEGLEEL